MIAIARDAIKKIVLNAKMDITSIQMENVLNVQLHAPNAQVVHLMIAWQEAVILIIIITQVLFIATAHNAVQTVEIALHIQLVLAAMMDTI